MSEAQLEDLDTLEGLFINEEYSLETFHFGKKEIKLQGLQAASTDFDLTGQILWPAAKLLAAFLAENIELMIERIMACELGSGLGLAGLLCGQYCNTVLSDHNSRVLHILQQNVSSNPSSFQVRCQQMDWECPESVEGLKQMSPDGKGFDLVLGADICYSLKALPCIFSALSSLLSRTSGSQGFLGYVSRAAAIDRGICTEARASGLQLQEVPNTRQMVGAGLEGMIYSFTHLEDRVKL